MKSRTLRIWLRPGIKIKRWIGLFMLAIVLLGLALAMFAVWIYRSYDFPDSLQGPVGWLTLQPISQLWRAVLLLASALILLAFAFYRVSSSLLTPLLAASPGTRPLSEIVNEHHFGPVKPELNVVAIGGGTGLSALLRGLKLHDIDITAIVTVADDGGSTGRIRDVFNMPAPGDIRNCMVSLADDESLMGRLFHYRFDTEGSELSGHSFGNLFITAMTQVTGSFERAVIESSDVLNVRGRVLPSTVENVTLCAHMADGSVLRGESTIAHEKPAISEIFLEPDAPGAYTPALAAILKADLVILGPGSLYTSVLPNLLVDGVREAIRWSTAPTAYVCNVATQHGETDNYGYEDHVREVMRYLGKDQLNYALVNDNPAAAEAIRDEWQVEAILYDGQTHVDDSVEIIARDMVSNSNPLRHDPAKLSEVLIEIARRAQAERLAQQREHRGTVLVAPTTTRAEDQRFSA
ncbi:MAG TPA: gluconeogenesis factor YvcK family protein [Thermomicrobiales bacterium]|nr:gluconeogenesis factor YvcK family protein [Thermomicrobiales bacterium]